MADKPKYLTEDEILRYLNDEFNMAPEIKDVDLHNHTTGSDGEDSPLLLLYRANKMGLKTISITDHDSKKGYDLLIEQIERFLKYYEEIDTREDLTEDEKLKRKKGARRLLRVIEETKIIPGYEVKTCFAGCPYVEILAYGADVEVLDKKLAEIHKNLANSTKVISQGLTKIVEKSHESEDKRMDKKLKKRKAKNDK